MWVGVCVSVCLHTTGYTFLWATVSNVLLWTRKMCVRVCVKSLNTPPPPPVFPVPAALQTSSAHSSNQEEASNIASNKPIKLLLLKGSTSGHKPPRHLPLFLSPLSNSIIFPSMATLLFISPSLFVSVLHPFFTLCSCLYLSRYFSPFLSGCSPRVLYPFSLWP